jgi:hypothetical protein
VNASVLEWYQLYNTLEAALPILDSCEMFVGQNFRSTYRNGFVLHRLEIRNASDRNYINQLLKMSNIQIIRNLFHILSVSLDLDQSRSEGILTIRNGFDQDLDRLR